jgi:hypothetical protein
MARIPLYFYLYRLSRLMDWIVVAKSLSSREAMAMLLVSSNISTSGIHGVSYR